MMEEAMKALVQHDTPEALTAASRRSRSGRVAHRLLAIRDVLLGRSRTWVCEQYGVSRENLRHWVAWYNEAGMAGLADAPHPGRPPKLSAEQLEMLKERVSAPPDLGRDGVGRWRAADVQRLLAQEYGVHYSSIAGVCALLLRWTQLLRQRSTDLKVQNPARVSCLLCRCQALSASGFSPAPELGKLHRLLEDLARGAVTQGVV